jgi:hypothetical protein
MRSSATAQRPCRPADRLPGNQYLPRADGGPFALYELSAANLLAGAPSAQQVSLVAMQVGGAIPESATFVLLGTSALGPVAMLLHRRLRADTRRPS